MIPVPYRQKKPILDGWEKLRLGEPVLSQYFGRRLQNIGVLLGEPSHWLVDVDLDHPLALEIASQHLPPTGAIFGRASKPSSHWLYTSAAPVATRQWRLPGRQMVVELRSTGAQTIFPGSVHESGEPIEWVVIGEPALVDPNELRSQLQIINDEVFRCLGISSGGHVNARAISGNVPISVISRARRYLAKMSPAVSGQGGHSATFHAACVLVIGFGLDRQTALTILHDWNQLCEPPWNDKELEHKVDDAMQQPGWRGYLLARDRRTPEATLNKAVARANRHAIEHRRRDRRRSRA